MRDVPTWMDSDLKCYVWKACADQNVKLFRTLLRLHPDLVTEFFALIPVTLFQSRSVITNDRMLRCALRCLRQVMSKKKRREFLSQPENGCQNLTLEIATTQTLSPNVGDPRPWNMLVKEGFWPNSDPDYILWDTFRLKSPMHLIHRLPFASADELNSTWVRCMRSSGVSHAVVQTLHGEEFRSELFRLAQICIPKQLSFLVMMYMFLPEICKAIKISS